jgi:hypothetical protein
MASGMKYRAVDESTKGCLLLSSYVVSVLLVTLVILWLALEYGSW